MTVGHGWEAKLTGEVIILGRVIERLGLIIRILSMVNSGFVPDGCIECCGESVQYLQCVNYSNSRVHSYGQLEWPYCSPVSFLLNLVEVNLDFCKTTIELSVLLQKPPFTCEYYF